MKAQQLLVAVAATPHDANVLIQFSDGQTIAAATAEQENGNLVIKLEAPLAKPAPRKPIAPKPAPAAEANTPEPAPVPATPPANSEAATDTPPPSEEKAAPASEESDVPLAQS